MELPRRSADDVFLSDGVFTATLKRLSERDAVGEIRIGIFNAFDFRTRMLPYWYADKRMAPCSVRTLGDALHAAGFRKLRIVLQQWSPKVRPSKAEIDGGPIDILLVSAMQVHAEPSYDLIRDAHGLGANRPLIIAGGPKAIYEPTDYFELGPEPGVGADCVVTGEAFVLLDLLDKVLNHRRNGESMRAAFERTRRMGDLESVPGLAYLSPDASPARPVAVSTGVQRLLRDLDEMPLPDAGYRHLEPPHRGRRMKPQPHPASKIAWRSPISSIISTQGCKFNCSYCPIPAVNQRTWRHKSPKRLAAEIKHVYEQFGITCFFGTDDNFFNRRETVVELMTELAQTQSGGQPLGKQIRFYTEATQFDVHKNADLLDLCRRGGLRGIWFGIEDITAELVNKGQDAGKTAQLFKRLHGHGIQPMAMMIHSDEQPLRCENGNLSGLLNQARYLFENGAVSYQCTYLGPAVGTRNLEPALQSGEMFLTVGGKSVPQAFYDGNHVVSSGHPRPWDRQLNLLRAYATFYNPINMLRTVFEVRKSRVGWKRLLFQLVGHIGLVMTVPRLVVWAWQLRRGPVVPCRSLLRARIPMISAETGLEMPWAIEFLPSEESVPLPAGRPRRVNVPVRESTVDRHEPEPVAAMV